MTGVVTIPPNCILANPDVAGIGTRISIYVQNIWCLIITLLIFGRRKVRENGASLIQVQSSTIVLTTGALFSSAFIQATVYELSAYHAIIVLSLGWANYMSSTLYALVADYTRRKQSPGSEIWRQPLNIFTPPGSSRLGFLRASLMHASVGMFAAFGLWFWATVDTFGSTAQCAPRLPIPIRILGHTILSTSPATRKAFLVVHTSFALSSLVGTITSVLVMTGLANNPQVTVLGERYTRLLSPVRTETILLMRIIWQAFLNLGILVAIIVSTESMVYEAAPFVQPGESEWTYGQTISIFLLIPGLLETLYALSEKDPEETAKNDGQPSRAQRSGGEASPVNAGDRV